jgi:hypothetical protein
MRIQIPAYTDHWMRGDRFGELLRTSWMRPGAVHVRARLLTKHRFGERVELAHVRLDKSQRTVRVILADCEVVS